MAIEDNSLNCSEEDYRGLHIPSYSLLASIEKYGVDVIQGVKVKFELKFGSLVDVMCFEPHRLDDLFYRGRSVKSPTSTHKKVVDEILANITADIGGTQEQMGILGRKRKKQVKITDDLSNYRAQILLYAKKHGVLKSYSDDNTFETIVKSSSEYFKDKITSRGKMLIKPEMWALAQQTATTLQTHPFTAKYFNHKTPGVDILYQYKFVTDINGRRVKGMLDCLIVNHNEKLLIPVDLKTGEAPVKDFPMLYTSHRYYIQGALYREALKSILENDFDITDYKVKPFEFVYISKSNPYKPMIFIATDEMHEAAMNGFTDKFGYKYKGVNELIEEYYACIDSGFCDYTEEETLSKGRIEMNDVVKNDEKKQNNG